VSRHGESVELSAKDHDGPNRPELGGLGRIPRSVGRAESGLTRLDAFGVVGWSPLLDLLVSALHEIAVLITARRAKLLPQRSAHLTVGANDCLFSAHDSQFSTLRPRPLPPPRSRASGL